MTLNPQDHDSAPSIHRQFTTTHWTAVRMAGPDSAPGAKDAPENLCRAYSYPLYAYVRRKGFQEAKDLTQQLFARLLQGERLMMADPAHGRFRAFLPPALNHFLINEQRNEELRPLIEIVVQKSAVTFLPPRCSTYWNS